MNAMLLFLFIFSGQFEPLAFGETNTFTLVRDASYKDIRPANFIANASFSYRATYDGVISNQTAFAQALRNSGVRGLRFPGGTMAHFYMWEGKEVTDALKIDIDPVKRCWYKLYSPVDYSGSSDPNVSHWPKSYYTPLTNFLDFCRQEQFFPLLQVNTSFYYDAAAARTRAICRSNFITNYETSVSIVTNYWDHDRIQDATNRLAENIQTYIIDQGYEDICKYWEIGNEDFYNKDWEGDGPLDDAAEYAEILAGYADIIKSKVPEAEIYFAGEQWRDSVLGWIATNAPQSLSKITGTGKHYPFAAWPLPTNSAMANNPEAFVVTDVKFDQNIASERSALDAAGYTNIAVATTETTMWKLNGTYPWNSTGLNATTARALMTAHNFGELVFRPLQDSLLTVHFDLSSPFFGILPHDAWIENVASSNDLPVTHIRREGSDLADLHSYDFWPELDSPLSAVSADRRIDGYFRTPAAWVMNFYGGLSGRQLVSVDQNDGDEYVSAFSAYGGEDAGEIGIIVVNRTACSQYYKLKNDGQFSIPVHYAESVVLEATDPQTGLPSLNGVLCEGGASDEYQVYTTNKYVRGSGYADTVFLQGWIRPWSVTFIPVQVDGAGFYNEKFFSYDQDLVLTNGSLMAQGNLAWVALDSWASTGLVSALESRLDFCLNPASSGNNVYGFVQEEEDLILPATGSSIVRTVDLSVETLPWNSTGAQSFGAGFYADGSLPAAGSWGATVGMTVQFADFSGTPHLIIRRRGTDGSIDSWNGSAWTDDFTTALSSVSLGDLYTVRATLTDTSSVTFDVLDASGTVLESATSSTTAIYSYTNGLRWTVGDYNSQNAAVPCEFSVYRMDKETEQ